MKRQKRMSKADGNDTPAIIGDYDCVVVGISVYVNRVLNFLKKLRRSPARLVLILNSKETNFLKDRTSRELYVDRIIRPVLEDTGIRSLIERGGVELIFRKKEDNLSSWIRLFVALFDKLTEERKCKKVAVEVSNFPMPIKIAAVVSASLYQNVDIFYVPARKGIKDFSLTSYPEKEIEDVGEKPIRIPKPNIKNPLKMKPTGRTVGRGNMMYFVVKAMSKLCNGDTRKKVDSTDLLTGLREVLREDGFEDEANDQHLRIKMTRQVDALSSAGIVEKIKRGTTYSVRLTELGAALAGAINGGTLEGVGVGVVNTEMGQRMEVLIERMAKYIEEIRKLKSDKEQESSEH